MNAQTVLPPAAAHEGVEAAKDLHLCPLRLDNVTAILDSVADGILTVDERLRITHFKRAAEAVTGLPAKEAVDRSCLDIFRQLLSG